MAWLVSLAPAITAVASVAGTITQATLGGIQASQAQRGLKAQERQAQALLTRNQLTSQRATLVGSSGNRAGTGTFGDLNPASTNRTSLLGG